ncbi:threonylcarbamoyl-AMP synthase [Candidatus Saganbacteria bacterium]|nr:threonylcarbamoyl-AMP synthase [Candidatus Saganbacteria bacterium]
MKNKIRQAVKIILNGGIIAFPTDTVFGIGACLNQPQAIRRIFKIKKRPRSKPLQILIGTIEQAQELGIFNDKDLAFARKKWPGPYTLIVPKTQKVSKLITGGLETVGLRIPAHKTILQLIKLCGPIAATSANIAGKPPILNSSSLQLKMLAVDYVLGGRVKLKKSSQVINLITGKIIRR